MLADAFVLIRFCLPFTAAMTIDPTVMAKYQNGFGECAQEVQRYLGSIDGLSSEVRVRLMHHLSNCMNQVQKVPSYGVFRSTPGCRAPPRARLFPVWASVLCSVRRSGDDVIRLPGSTHIAVFRV